MKAYSTELAILLEVAYPLIKTTYIGASILPWIIIAFFLIACSDPTTEDRDLKVFDRSHETIIISDIDDTLRRTAVRHYYYLIKNSFVTRDITFLHLSDLWSSLANDMEFVRFYYVSAAPAIDGFNFFNVVRESLINDDFPLGQFLGRTDIMEDIFSYKLSVHRKIIARHINAHIVLIGDDTQYDLKVFKQLKRDFPMSKIDYFVHLVDNDENREIQNFHFVSAADLAIRFFELGLLSDASTRGIVDKIKTSVESRDLWHRIWPKWMSCKGFNVEWRQLFNSHNDLFPTPLASLELAYDLSCR